ncbi:hypothetical protein RHSIM_Rhsim03G0208300 [Rhododendron simsii]|uniref:Fungal lipase-like domain-containing protein n=1 Tax=Rhododendron simsii TaxID=118357 RepID=A0A834H9P1_RHOSS|nr:hypothetical protein RHSIM_Rhsim03G0208300 [Rhododendron simsii]
MASARQNFGLSGPLELTFVDCLVFGFPRERSSINLEVRSPDKGSQWKNSCHRRSVAASLVQGVYILERDRQEKRQGRHALAPPWWDFFNFQLIRKLVDNADQSIFGAVYEFRFPPSDDNYQLDQKPPRYIIAFRGTIIKPGTRSQDLKLGLQFVRDRLQQSSRFKLAMEAVQSTVFFAGCTNIWLAGHSMGSAIALLAGKNMVKMGGFIETYLFNPPFPTDPLEQIKNQKLKHGVRFASAITAGVAVALSGHRQRAQMDDSFAGWVPYLFLNPSDPLSAGYIRYFKQREKMMKIAHGAIARFAKQNSSLSGRSQFSVARGRESEASHLLPSAYLIINLSSTKGFNQAHGIHQWWKNMDCDFKLHQFRLLLSMSLRERLLLDLVYDKRIMEQASVLAKANMNHNKDQFKSKELDMD